MWTLAYKHGVVMNTKPTIDDGLLIAHSLLHRLRGRRAGDEPTIDDGLLIPHSLLHRLRGRSVGDEGAESFERVRGSLVFENGTGVFDLAGVFEMLGSSTPDPFSSEYRREGE